MKDTLVLFGGMNRKSSMKWMVTSVFLIGCSFFSCTSKNEETKGNKADLELVEQLEVSGLNLSGHQLAEAYCGACHLKPAPELLDKKTWQHSVLPDMRRRIGLITEDDFGIAVGEDNDAPPGIYAQTALITKDEWVKIQDYYLQAAPDTLQGHDPYKKVEEGLPGFEPFFPTFNKKRPNLTTLTGWDEQEKILYVGDRFRQLFQIDGKSMMILDSIPISSPASSIKFSPDKGFDLLTLGVMDPSNFAIGQLNKYTDFDQNAKELILDSLRRPVHFSYADLNQDGREDIIICNFGHHIGNLSWYENTSKGYIPHLLNGQPGARKTVITDLNGDGRPDIVVLMTQAREGVYAYINQGEGKFSEQIWLKFHPVFGGSDFEMVDFNKDGHLDLLVVNGDNADKSPILKPYHGIRIFLNDGNNQFEESWFYPLYGASGLLVDDFDQNGELDLAVISYFPDPNQMLNFIYFKNNGNLDFTAHFNKQLGAYSWLTMEKGDLDGDGDLDIVLGGFDFRSQHHFPMKEWIPLAILKNTLNP